MRGGHRACPDRLASVDSDAGTGAFSHRLGMRDQEPEPVLRLDDVGYVHADQFRAAKGTCEADEKERAVASAGQRRSTRADQFTLIGDGEGGRTARWGSVLAADPTESFADSRVLGIERTANDAAGAGDCCDPAAESRQRVAFAGGGKEGADDLGCGRHRLEAVLGAPGIEVRPVRGKGL